MKTLPKSRLCVSCNKRKLRSAFYRHATNRDRLTHECKPCRTKRALARYYANREYCIAMAIDWQRRRSQVAKLNQV